MAGDAEPLEIGDLIRDGALIINDGYRAKNSELSNIGIPFARAGNIDGGFHFEDADRVPPETLERVGMKRSKAGDVVFTSKGTVGRFAFVGEDTPEFVYSPQLCFWRSGDTSRIDPRWLFYWMNGREFYLQFKGVAGQTDMAEYVSLGDQRSMKMTLPPPARQKAIARILGTLDDKIALNRRMNLTLESVARALFQSWFVNFDPVRAKIDGRKPIGLDATTAGLFPDQISHADNLLIPKGWQPKAVYDCAKFINGVAFRNVQFSSDGSGLPVVKITELKDGISAQTNFTTDELEPKYKIQDGELLFSWSGSPDTSIDTFVWAGGDGWLNQHIFKVEPHHPEEKLFVYYLLKHLNPTFIEIARDKQTTGLGHVTAQDMKRLKVAFPTKPILQAFQRTVQPLFERSFATLMESRTLATLRDTLLPKLLSGEVPVSVPTEEMNPKVP